MTKWKQCQLKTSSSIFRSENNAVVGVWLLSINVLKKVSLFCNYDTETKVEPHFRNLGDNSPTSDGFTLVVKEKNHLELWDTKLPDTLKLLLALYSSRTTCRIYPMDLSMPTESTVLGPYSRYLIVEVFATRTKFI